MAKGKGTPKSADAAKRNRDLSSMRGEVVAVVCSDMHLSHRAPIARSAEPNWFDAMDRTLYQLRAMCRVLDCPLVIAGDIFDKWNAPAELINFAIQKLPKRVLAVPGQHDLPYHNKELIHKSAYWTLVSSGRIKDLTDKRKWPKDNEYGDYQFGELDTGAVTLVGFGWNDDLVNIEKDDSKRVAIIHSYIWTDGHAYPDAPKHHSFHKWHELLVGNFEVAFFGDNHKGFWFGAEDHDNLWTMNCGTLMRRKADEINYKPMVGLLHRKGYFSPYYLDCSEDKFIDIEQALAMVENGLELTEFIEDLSKLGEGGINFYEAVKQFLNDNGISKRIRRHVLQALEKHDD
jgi:DNA repair exonuclease SbcCD nuclease subunit